MSFGRSSVVSPESAWLLVTETRMKPAGPEPVSVTETATEIGTSLWFGGRRTLGLALQVTVGGVVSTPRGRGVNVVVKVLGSTSKNAADTSVCSSWPPSV